MSRYQSVDPKSLAARSEEVELLGETAMQIFLDYRTGIERLGKCWGADLDEFGRTFEQKYNPAQETFENLLRSFPEAFSSTASVLLHTAKNFAGAESGNLDISLDLGKRR